MWGEVLPPLRRGHPVVLPGSSHHHNPHEATPCTVTPGWAQQVFVYLAIFGITVAFSSGLDFFKTYVLAFSFIFGESLKQLFQVGMACWGMTKRPPGGCTLHIRLSLGCYNDRGATLYQSQHE